MLRNQFFFLPPVVNKLWWPWFWRWESIPESSFHHPPPWFRKWCCSCPNYVIWSHLNPQNEIIWHLYSGVKNSVCGTALHPILDASGQTNHISIHIWSLHFPQIDLHSPLISKQQPTRRPTGLLHPTNLCNIRDSCMAFLQLGYICVGLDVCSLFTGSSISGINGSRRNCNSQLQRHNDNDIAPLE